MTHEETSLQTKKALCASLKKLMKEKPFSKITVSELIKECNLNRKTFYYHFEDIYSLLKWMLEQETFEILKQFDLLVDYRDAFDFVIDYVKGNSYFLNFIKIEIIIIIIFILFNIKERIVIILNKIRIIKEI